MMLGKPTYRRRREEKLSWYGGQGITPIGDDGGGGQLIITADDERGGLGAQRIAAIIEFNRCPHSACAGGRRKRIASRRRQLWLPVSTTPQPD
jgi:hypothetical protein